MVETIKFSQFTDAGDLKNNEQTVGFGDGGNQRYNNPWTFLAPGTTEQRPSPSPEMYYRLRYNTEAETYEYFFPEPEPDGEWIQIEDSGDIAALEARLAAHTEGDGASMIGLQDQAGVTDKTVQDLANATLIAQTNNGTISNGQFLSQLDDGMVAVENGSGVLSSRILTGTENQIDIASGAGTANPTFSLSETLDLPGTFTIQGSVVVDEIINDDTMASATAENLSTSLAIKTYVDAHGGTAGGNPGAIQYNDGGVLGGDDAFTTDGAGNLSLTGTLGVNGDVAIDNGTLDMNMNLITDVLDPISPQDAATKAYVDAAVTPARFIAPVVAATISNLAATYDNGAGGVGATLTADADGAASIDDIALNLNDRVLFKNQTDPVENGVYYVSDAGGVSDPAVYTRATDYDEPSEILPGDLVPVLQGTVNAQTLWLETQTVTTIGTDPIQFVQVQVDTSNIVTIDGVQTITGAKTFSANVTLNNSSTLQLNGTTAIDQILNEDDMISDSDTAVPTQQSVKAYVDNQTVTVGGAAGAIQYNDSGAFGGDDNITTDGAGNLAITGTLTLNGLLSVDGADADFNDNQIKNVATPTDNGDAVNKAYADSLIPGGGFKSMQIFDTPGITTWTKPAGINTVIVELVGGGGGGGGVAATGSTTLASSGGGGGGGYSRKMIDVSAVPSATVQVGAGGTAGAIGGTGGTGGTSAFGSIDCQATGGTGGGGSSAFSWISNSAVNGGTGGVGSLGDINLNGMDGGNGQVLASQSVTTFSWGGGTLLGGARGCGTGAKTIRNGYNYGGGGAGMVNGASSAGSVGSVGAPGIVIVYEFA